MPSYKDDGRRPRRQRSNGRCVDRSESGNGNGNGSGVPRTAATGSRAQASLASSRSQHYILPQNYPSSIGSSTVGKINNTRNGGSQSRSPGAPPPPPPPMPPPPRGGNSSFHSTSATARDKGQSLSSIERDLAKRGRSLSLARSKKSSATSTLPLIDANGERRPRSSSRPKSRRQQQPRRSNSMRDTKSSVGLHTSEKNDYNDATTRKPNRKLSRSRDSKDDDDALVEHQSPPVPSVVVMEEKSRRSSRRRNRSNPSHSRKKKSSSAPSTTSSSGAATKTSRKFVVEIDTIHNTVVQVFEFSETGTLPSSKKDDNTASSSRTGKEPTFIEAIRRQYSGGEKKPSSRSTTSSRGRSTSRSRGSPSLARKDDDQSTTSTSTKKIVVESDERDNIIQVFEFSDSGALPAPPATRDESPFSQREAYAAGDNAAYEKKPASTTIDDFMSKQKSQSSQPSRTRRAASASRVSASASRASTLRSSLRDEGTVVSQARVRFAFDNEDRSKPASALDTSETSKESAESNRVERSVSPVDNQEEIFRGSALTSSMVSQDSYCGMCALDTSEKSDMSTSRRSVSFMSDQGDHERLQALKSLVPSKVKSPLDTSERSDESNARRSVSFRMDQDTRQLPTRGRPAVTRSMTGEDLPGFQRARSLSRSHSLVINDSSSLTASIYDDPPISPSTRGRSDMSSTAVNSQGRSAVPRQTRSLSRTRNAVIRDQVDFDPEAQGIYEKTFRRDALPFEKMPVQKSLISHSTAETFVSALTFEEEYDSFFTNQTTQAVGGGDPLMNSTLTIFESECDEDERSLLSDPTSLMDLRPPSTLHEGTALPASKSGVKVHQMEDDPSTTGEKKSNRSRIRNMLSIKSTGKRRPIRPIPGSSKPLLDVSESTRETLGTDGSSVLALESAQNSLLRTQGYARGGQALENHPGSGGRQKSRLSRFLKR